MTYQITIRPFNNSRCPLVYYHNYSSFGFIRAFLWAVKTYPKHKVNIYRVTVE